MSNLPFQFGEKVGFISMTHPATLAGVGGATAGVASGLISPGEYEDEDGNVKKRSRIGSALRRALMLGAGGVGAGLAYDYFSPRATDAQKYNVKTRQPIKPTVDFPMTDMERKMMGAYGGSDVGARTNLHDQLDAPNPFLEGRNRALDVKIPQQNQPEVSGVKSRPGLA